jgi:glycosyltransferase involved in cell wall biosynthesis
MKKKILFIVSSMESGGVSKSMSSLLNVIDTQRYEIDCLIIVSQGVFMDTIPTNVNLISNEKTALFFSSFPVNLIKLVTRGWIYLALLRFLAALLMKMNKGWGGWLLSKGINKLPKEYDLAVDYNGQQQLYFLIDRVKAKKKATFFHSDYAKWSYYYSMDKKYMPKADTIFTISEKCINSLKDFFPDSASKIRLFENISSVKTIQIMANEVTTDPLDGDFFKIITIGHLSEMKGTDLALKAAKILKVKGLTFKWYFIGQNQNTHLYQKMVKDNQIENEIVFMGLKSNPYSYIKQADIVVHPSLFEGKSIALDEAKILCKPIVVTNFSTVSDQFINKENASICEMNPEDIAEKIIELHQNEKLRTQYIEYLATHCYSNESEIEKLYQLIQ